MNKRIQKLFVCLVTLAILIPGDALSTDLKESPENNKNSQSLIVSKAQICENVTGQIPVNPTIALSFAKGKAFCFSEIEGIASSTVIFHNWLRRDAHMVGIKLTVKPPRWSTFSSISLREADKGPWRVEITDMDGTILKTLRFSIVD